MRRKSRMVAAVALLLVFLPLHLAFGDSKFTPLKEPTLSGEKPLTEEQLDSLLKKYPSLKDKIMKAYEAGYSEEMIESSAKRIVPKEIFDQWNKTPKVVGRFQGYCTQNLFYVLDTRLGHVWLVVPGGVQYTGIVKPIERFGEMLYPRRK